jgi:hypothetical protein
MYRFLILCWILIIIQCFSCNPPSKGILEFDLVLTNELVPLENLGLPVRMKIDSKNRLLYFLVQKGQFLGKAYHLDSLKLINSFIKSGEGPKEQVIGWTLQIDHQKSLIFSTDPIKKRLFAYSMDSILSNTLGFAPSFQIDLRKQPPQKPLVLSDSTILDFRENYLTGDSFGYNKINFQGDLIKPVGGFPSSEEKISNYQESAAYAGDLNISEDGSFIIRTYSFTDKIEKLDLNGNVLKTYHGPLGFEPSFATDDLGGGSSRVRPVKNSLKAFVKQAVIGKNKVYVLFDGKDFYRDDEQANILLEFDLDLNLKRILKLEQSINSFDIDFESNVLYALSVDYEDHLIKYKL